MKNRYCVIMAGGVGSRFWPISRSSMPKQFLDITGSGKTFLRETFDRFAKILPVENIFVVTGKFMPMACSYWPYGEYRYVSYAKNDESYLGEFKATGYSHIYTYCHVIAADDNPNKDKYFGTISYSRGENKDKKYAWIFKAKEDELNTLFP